MESFPPIPPENLAPKPLLRNSVRPDPDAKPRPDLAGARLKGPSSPDVYMVDPDGYLRHVYLFTYEWVFRDHSGILVSADLPRIAQRPDLWYGCLAQDLYGGPVYLIDGGPGRNIKNPIPTPAVMDKYHFNWGRVQKVYGVFLQAFSTGPEWH